VYAGEDAERKGEKGEASEDAYARMKPAMASAARLREPRALPKVEPPAPVPEGAAGVVPEAEAEAETAGVVPGATLVCLTVEGERVVALV